MNENFDPYREALVIEQKTSWPNDLDVAPRQRADVERRLHADPARAARLEYVRLYSGFCRHITVTAADLERLEVR